MEFFSKIIHYIRLSEERTTFPKTFKEELDYQCSKILTFASLITMSWLTYIPIDLKLHPDKPLMIALRISFPVAGLLLFNTRFFRPLRTRPLLMLTLYGAYMEIIGGIIAAVAGGDSAYIGGYVFLLTLLAVVPFQKTAAYTILLVSLLIFFSVSVMCGTDFSRTQLIYSRNDLLCAAFIISCFIYILDNTRYIKWIKSKEAEFGQIVIEDQKNQLEEQINIAGELHKSLFPKDVPLINEAVISYKCTPMMELGGDFIDYHFDEKEKILGLFVCDVSGHGVAGALFLQWLRYH